MPQLSFQHMCELIWKDPIAGAQTAKAQHRSHRQRKYEMAAVGYALAYRLRAVPEWIDGFYALPFFGGGYERNTDHLLLHCIQYVYDDRTGSDSDRAGEHARAMKPLFDQELHPTHLLEALSNQGFRGLQSAYGQFLPTATQLRPMQDDIKQTSPPSTDKRFDHDPGTQGAGGAGMSEEENDDRPTPPKARIKRPTAKEILNDYLLVSMEPRNDMYKLLELEVGESRHLQITRVQNADDDLILFQGKLTVLPGIRPSRLNSPLKPALPPDPATAGYLAD